MLSPQLLIPPQAEASGGTMNHETSKGSPMKLLCGNVTPSINRLTEPTLRTRCCQPRYSHKAITTAAQCAFGCSGTTYCSALEVRHQRPGVRQCRFQAIALCSDFSHFLAIILHFNLKVDFELSIDKGCHCAAASNLHSLPAQFAKACRRHDAAVAFSFSFSSNATRCLRTSFSQQMFSSVSGRNCKRCILQC